MGEKKIKNLKSPNLFDKIRHIMKYKERNNVLSEGAPLLLK